MNVNGNNTLFLDNGGCNEALKKGHTNNICNSINTNKELYIYIRTLTYTENLVDHQRNK